MPAGGQDPHHLLRRINTAVQDGYWQQIGSRPIRPLSTVVLPPGKVGA